jgi:hypothetical protein
VPAFKTVLQEHTAGDPMKPDCLWTNLSMQAISRLMSAAGFPASPYLVEQLLDHCKLGHRQAFKYLTMRQHKDRHQQFDILNAYKQSFLDSPNPIISIDTKKKEVLGLFYRKGRLFTAEGREVFDHDFLSFSKGTVIPHGIYASFSGGLPKVTTRIRTRRNFCCSATAAAATAHRNICSKKTCRRWWIAWESRFAWLTTRPTVPSTIRSNTACFRM